MGKGGDDSMWLVSVALCPMGLTLIICAAVIQPYQGMTAEIQTSLFVLGSFFMLISICINCLLKHFYPVDIDDLRVEVKHTMRDRKRLKRRKEKRRNLKSALQISIPGFEDVKIRPKLDDISDSDHDSSDDEGKVDPTTRW
mmetsp:Transcript_17374/g.20455  ORF Transcript_17374/g.20455 Transcript_17374/m.20455 type:complete len:141 (-) Transcript_17374:414-836(-)